MREMDKSEDTKHKYDDIIDLDRPLSKHPKLSIDQRAAQFAPFSALVGYSDVLSETRRRTDKEKILTNDEMENINDRLNYIVNNDCKYKITYFINDRYKSGGSYKTTSKRIKRIDLYNRCVKFTDKTDILIDNIVHIDIDNYGEY